ncbi:hypothetical protein [Streptomyces sp. NBC_01462]|uniref:hypothetical protein n=1 Tax=Streptomyces sp. NBC_01462 TaxID=2903876 RepID=UPI002E2F07C2|nr:hypothetical protein [Streptomyces sp. NBC_01462]
MVLRSRRGTETAPASIAAAAEQLPDATTLDGELVVWNQDRLAFDLLRLSGTDTYRRLRAAAFRAVDVSPSTTNPDAVREWPISANRAAGMVVTAYTARQRGF